ncbi:hypothetical protein [Iodobacter sp.]|uniref:hypothetical protein n=1 Tax=Iodobacter sp. TaxID=1915058 RepID=UPI0025EE0484|nr:hypothetical protein [Iodobacter sp.]
MKPPFHQGKILSILIFVLLVLMFLIVYVASTSLNSGPSSPAWQGLIYAFLLPSLAPYIPLVVNVGLGRSRKEQFMGLLATSIGYGIYLPYVLSHLTFTNNDPWLWMVTVIVVSLLISIATTICIKKLTSPFKDSSR